MITSAALTLSLLLASVVALPQAVPPPAAAGAPAVDPDAAADAGAAAAAAPAPAAAAAPAPAAAAAPAPAAAAAPAPAAAAAPAPAAAAAPAPAAAAAPAPAAAAAAPAAAGPGAPQPAGQAVTAPGGAAAVQLPIQQVFAGPGLMAGGPGGIFWMSNDPQNNVVFSANIDTFGNMTFGGAWTTGGLGAHVVPNNVPNAFESQGSVKVVDNFLTVVNAGSNSVALFNIDFEFPALIRPIGPAFDSAGDFPIGTTVGQVNHNTCILNAGTRNTVACFVINLRSGLQPIENTFRSLGLNLANPPVSGSGTPNEIFFNDVQSKLWVTLKNNGATPGALLTWDVDQDTFALSDTPVVTTTPVASSMTQVKDGLSVFTNSIGTGVAAFQIFDGLAALQPPVPQPIVPIPGSIHNAWSEDSALTGNYYMADNQADMFTEIAVDPNTLVTTIVQQTKLPQGGFCMDEEICELNAHDTLFIVCAGTLTMEVFSLNGPGDAVHIQSFDFAGAAQQAGVPLDSVNIAGTNCFQQG